jgi:GTP-binding protein
MEIKNAIFVGSFVREDKCPTISMPEYAFIGRSNVGKSSLINMLCRKKDLAKVSNTPGKTQTINYFDIDNKWFMVDLPGYGYARISRTKREEWEKMIHYFLKNRKNLQYVFLLIDSMIPPQKIDMDFMNWLGENRVPFVIAYTKSDRILPIDLKKNLRKIREEILKSWETLPIEFITSAEKRRGKVEILSFIAENNAAAELDAE